MITLIVYKEGATRVLGLGMDPECERESSDWVVARCSTTLKSDGNVKLSKWFNKEKSICYRGNVKGERGFKKDDPWYIFVVPAQQLYECFIHQQTKDIINNNKNSTKKKKMKMSLDQMFNHSLRHTFPTPLELTCHTAPQDFPGLFDATWVVLGSTIYFFDKNCNIYYLKKDITGTTTCFSPSFELAGEMISYRKAPKVVALNGKIYVFGNSEYVDVSCEHVWAEVFEPYPDRLDGESKPLSSPIPPSSDVLFVAAMEKEKKIVVGWNYEFVDENLIKLLFPDFESTRGTAVFVYDVVGDSWVKYESNLLINVPRLFREPIAVGCCLYWLDTKMWAYDLITKQYFEGPIEDCFFSHVVDNDLTNMHKVSLFHLVGDFFYLLWFDCGDKVLHCATIQALRTTTNLNANHFKLRTTILSCQNFESSLSPFLYDPALIL